MRKAGNTESKINLSDSCWYLNRELTWLEFNRRVLHEAEDERTPLLERLKFIAIVSSNLDEFFMKRIGGLKQQLGAGLRELSLDGLTPLRQIQECHGFIRSLEERKYCLLLQVLEQLRQNGIIISPVKDLNARERKTLRNHFAVNIYPLLTPQSIDPAHPFPFISNLSLNLLVTLNYSAGLDMQLARVKVPVGAGTSRFIPVPGKHDRFVRLEDLMMSNLDMLFPGMKVVRCDLFRVTRNANTELDEEEADDLVEMIETELKERRFAPIVRMEAVQGIPALQRGRLAAELNINETDDVFEVPELLAMRDLFELTGLNYPHLRDTPHYPLVHPQLESQRNIFHIIRDAGSILLQHPYESFCAAVERFLRDAAVDKKVHGIKMTLYRTSSQGNIIEALLTAAQNGKQVAVVVELKARFDEAANIRLAEKMERAGIHVTYGVVGFKTHCKVIMIVRQDYNALRRYVHIGTGNYHTDTARIYSDIGLLSCSEALGNDVTELFNYLTTGFKPRRKYSRLLTAPRFLKQALLSKIERETALHLESGGGMIQFKINALEDGDIVKALYQASQAGVVIDLIVRDTCRLRPGIRGVSENIRVVSIVGRFLEHSRIYYFRNGGAEEYFISSADAMKRNLEARVEVLCPIETPSLAREIRTILDVHLRDSRSAWDMQPDGSYIQRMPADPDTAAGSHCRLMELAEKRVELHRKRMKKKKKVAETALPPE
ncbi:MAG: RNA degradosome polyphosphate kinase [Geobacteraceae bacterium GWC2_55_20]|nr:MAG: RNA degradosome polyphosphate kinase [Geobacteraceae bacterium GWC2_55_20]OGU18712.1 MAG: RNA degradosome polyphosphate kinase [Geobacteraceae bacterium GWF2_54_21]HBA73190.1 polyphosphate kinase 1 [Geobacter sp.]HCE67574.1 polyphosphate kinase 1 [Geobacter sp.]